MATNIASKATGGKQGSAKTSQLGLVKRGAADLKQRLQEASSAEQPMVLLWASADSERSCDEAAKNLKRIAASHPGTVGYPRPNTGKNTMLSFGVFQSTAFYFSVTSAQDIDLTLAGVVFFEAPVDMSKANAALAAAMGVTRFPCCQVFRSMKVLSSSTDCSAEALSAAVAQCSPDTAAKDSCYTALEGRLSPGEGCSGDGEGSPIEVSAAGGSAAGAARRAEENGGSSSSVFDPPAGKEARAGATRMMPGGNTGFFW